MPTSAVSTPNLPLLVMTFLPFRRPARVRGRIYPLRARDAEERWRRSYSAGNDGQSRPVRAIIATAMSGALFFGAASLPLKTVATRPLPGGSSRLDYASIDSKRHRLYISHLGGGLVIVFDTKARRVVTT